MNDEMNRVVPEDLVAFRVLEYQIAKIMDQCVVEDVPARVEMIDKTTETDPGDVPVGHKYMTNDSTLYKLPSGAYVEVIWRLELVDEDEARTRLDEMRELDG